jgi:hypothetical protein
MNNNKLILFAPPLAIVILAASSLSGWSQLDSSSNNEPTIVHNATNLAIEKYAGGDEISFKYGVPWPR